MFDHVIQQALIKQVIDDCDYYMVIVAGRYGSIGHDGLSYTEMEYRYALDAGKPIIGFVHKNPGGLAADRSESSDNGKEKLNEFRKLVQKKMCRFWESPADLGSQVSRSLVKLIKSNPGIGWVRGNLVPDESAIEEILGLRRRVEELQQELLAASSHGPEGASGLAQGNDLFNINYTFSASLTGYTSSASEYKDDVNIEWDDIFAALSPLMIDEATEGQLTKALNDLVCLEVFMDLSNSSQFKDHKLMSFRIDRDDFQTIKIQLRALGLIAKSAKNRSVKDTATYWTLTSYGDIMMTRLRAIKKPAISQDNTDV
jgi:hypothetical protein